MCHLRVTAIVLYDGAMIRDNGAVSESKVSYVPWTHEFLLGASWYCGLRSWSIIAPQMMCSLFVLPPFKIRFDPVSCQIYTDTKSPNAYLPSLN
jgi:hypothetical protein